MINIKQTLFLFALFFNSTMVHALTTDQIDQLKANTFIILPIDPYRKPRSKFEAQKYYNKNCSLKSLGPSEIHNCRELKKCDNDDCIMPFATHGTGFLLEEGNQLVSAWHVFLPTHITAITLLFPALKLREIDHRRKTLIDNAVPEFVLLNHDLEIVYDTRLLSRETRLKYSYIGDPLSPVYSSIGEAQGKPFGYFETLLTDVAVVKLNQNLGVGLKLSRRNMDRTSSTFYNAGFGSDRYSWEFSINEGYQDSVYNLKLEAGFDQPPFLIDPRPEDETSLLSLSVHEQLLYMGYTEDLIKKTYKKHSYELIQNSIKTVIEMEKRHQRDYVLESDPSVLFTNVKSLSGHSGAPFLNESGEVVGIVGTGFSRFSKDTTSRIQSFGTGVHLFNGNFPGTK